MTDHVISPSQNLSRPQAAQERLAALFPESSTVDRQRRRRITRAVVAAAVIVALIVTGVLVTNAFAGDAASYRTATVTKRSVAAVLNGVGTIEPVSQATVAFPVSGTVKTVDVKVGDTVTVGQQLASLDTTSLTATLHDKQATLAQAKLTLARALNGESVSPGGSSGAKPATTTASVSTGTTSGTSGSSIVLAAVTSASTNPAIASAQQAVLQAQQRVDRALAASATAIESATSTCAAAGVGSGTPTTTTTTTTATPVDPLAACSTALANVQAAQAEVAAAQEELSKATTQLDTLLANQSSSPAPSAGTSGGATSGSGGAPSGSTQSSPSSADLVKYQRAVDAAEAEVTVAEQGIAQAVIVTPVAGRVVGVNLAVGDEATSGSSTQNIVVEGSGGYEATTSVSVKHVAKVAVGQTAAVRADGTSRPLGGQVVSISTAPDSASSSSTTTYRVTIALANPNAKLRNGGTASIAIVTKRTTQALAIPTSAVTTNGTRHSVTVLSGSTTKQVQVGVGVVGDTWTEITSGLTAGQTVVLANIAKPLPDAATSSSSNSGGQGFPTFGGAGGFPSFGGGGR